MARFTPLPQIVRVAIPQQHLLDRLLCFCLNLQYLINEDNQILVNTVTGSFLSARNYLFLILIFFRAVYITYLYNKFLLDM